MKAVILCGGKGTRLREETEHRRHGKALTVTAVRPPGRFGELELARTRKSVDSTKSRRRKADTATPSNCLSR